MTRFVTQGGRKPRRRNRNFWLSKTAAAGEITGTLDATLGVATLSSAGQVEIAGTLSATLGTLTLSGVAAVDVAGTLSATLSAVTLTGVGTVDVAGTLSSTLGAATLTGAGTVSVTGTTTATLGNVTLSGTGTVSLTGSLDATLAALALTGAGTAAVVGTLSATLGTLTLTGEGSVDATVGTLSVTLGAVSLSATGTVTDAATPPAETPTGTTGGGGGAAQFYRGKRRHEIRKAIRSALRDLEGTKSTRSRKRKARRIAQALVADFGVVEFAPHLSAAGPPLPLRPLVDLQRQVFDLTLALREKEAVTAQRAAELQKLFEQYEAEAARLEAQDDEEAIAMILAVAA